MALRLGVVTTHPIQYQVPWFRMLSQRRDLELKVFFCMMPNAREQGEGFGNAFQWDVPLLDGYQWSVLRNVARRPSVANYWGCDTPGVSKVVEEGRFDAFLTNGWIVKSCLQTLAACRRQGVPCIVRGESNTLKKRPFWKTAAHRLLLRNYAAFLAIGRGNRDFYRNLGVEENRIFWTPYSVDNQRFFSQAKDLEKTRREIRRSFGIRREETVFLFSGKLVAKKHPLDLLKAYECAVRKAREAGRNLHLLLVGEGELSSQCRRFARGRGLSVTLAGFLNQSEITRAYVACDCLVLPSDSEETWGLVVNEAMACGRPAIVSDRVGCGPDLVVHGETGGTFPCRDWRALSDLMIAFAGDPAWLRQMGHRARRKIESYSVEQVADACLEAVRFVTHGALERPARRDFNPPLPVQSEDY